MVEIGADKERILTVGVATLLFVAAAGFLGGCSNDSPEQSRPEAASVDSRLKEAIWIGDPVERSARLSSLLAELGAESVDPVRGFLQSNVSRFQALDLGLMFQWWSLHEPREALDWLGENDRLYDVGLLQRIALSTWASTDFDAALHYFDNEMLSLEGVDRAVRATALVQAAYDSGSPQLMPYLLALPQGLDRARLIRGMVRRKLFFEPPEAVLAWADGLSASQHPRFKLEANRRIARELGASDPDLGMRWAAQVYDTDYGNSVLEHLTRAMVVDGRGPEAMEWLRGLSPGEPVDRAVAETYRYWIKRDRDAATDWIEGVPVESWLEPAFAKYVVGLSRSEGRRDTGIALAEKIQDENLRTDALTRIARAWFVEEPEAARVWVEGQNFDPDQLKLIFGATGRRLAPVPGR